MSNTYTTIQGDMWDSIAFSQLGSEAYTDRLMNLNPQHLGYYTFPAGIVLKLPDPAAVSYTHLTLPTTSRV